MPTGDMSMSDKQLLSIRESGGARVNIWEGSVRSGKTIASLWRWMHYVSTTTTYRGDLLIIGRTRASVARNVFSTLQDPSLFGEASKHVHYVSGADKALILGRTVWVMGASDVKSMATLKGATSAGAYVDEVTVIPEGFFTILLQRLWGPAQLFGTTNPDNPAHWFKKKFLDRVGKPGPKGLRNWRTWHFVLDDNPALPEHQKDSIRRENTGLWYRRYVLGEWVAADGAVYDMWNPAAHVVPWDDLPPMKAMLGVGLDFGTGNASAGLALGMDANGILYLCDEWRYDSTVTGKRLTTGQQSELFREWLHQRHTPGPTEPRMGPVFIDPSAAPFRTQLYADDIMGSLVDAVNDVHHGILVIGTLLHQRRLLVSDKCHGFIEEVTGYTWDESAAARGEDKPNKRDDHSLDAARYAVASTEFVWRQAMVNPVDIAAIRHMAEDARARSRELDIMNAPM